MNALSAHLRALARCERCPAMHKPVVIGRPVASRILLDFNLRFRVSDNGLVDRVAPLIGVEWSF